MGLIARLIEWGSLGTKTPAYSDAKKQEGWNVGEPPSAPEWNEVEYSRDLKINETLDRVDALGTACPVLTSEAMCGQLNFGYEWADPANGYNNYDTGDTIRDACIYRYGADKPNIMYLQTDNTTTKLTLAGGAPCWTFGGAFSKLDIVLNYPATPDDVHALACDATYLFVAWSTNGGTMRVSAFPLSDINAAASWTCDTGINYTTGEEDATKLLCASATRLALWMEAGSLGFNRLVVVITKATGVLESAGTGSYTGSEGNITDPRTRPVSDGLSVFWLQYKIVSTNRQYYVISAKLSDPSTSYYTSFDLGTFVAADTETHPKALATVNRCVCAFRADGKIVRVNYPYSTTVDPVAEIAAQPSPDYAGDQDVLVCSDGMSVWAVLAINPGSSTPYPVAYKVPMGRLSAYSDPIYCSVYGDPVVIEDSSVAEGVIGGRLLFDGRDLWYLSRGGRFFRITNPGAR